MGWRLMAGDCREQLGSLEPGSIDAVVTDPPYEIGYLNRGWDSTGVAWDQKTWQAVSRVLKPGGLLLSFAATRTYHRMAVAVEDSGFDIRDMVLWVYGQGQPKSLDVSRAIDEALGLEREVVGTRVVTEIDFEPGAKAQKKEIPITVPASDEARQWEGFGSALKPACEPLVLARKPLGADTLAQNVMRHGTGAIDIERSRIGEEGRWPANVILDPEAADLMDAQAGDMPKLAVGFEPPGGVSRFFYVAKPSQRERQAGLGEQESDVLWTAAGPRTAEPVPQNDHPTVKPIQLMRYLVRMVCPPGGVVLDPFTGSGTTGLAALMEGRGFVGVEKDPEFIKLAEARFDYLRGGGEF